VKTVLTGLLAAFPHLAASGLAPVAAAAGWMAAQPLAWGFCAGAACGPRILRHLPRRHP
jgi:hypothetical protein